MMKSDRSGFRVRGSGGKGQHSPLHPFTPSPVHSPFPIPHSPFSTGFTLLEVLLALGLTAVVLALVGTAVNSTLRTIDSGRRHTEREQLARAIMHRIADDLRSVVRYEPFDDTGLNSSTGGMSGGDGSGSGPGNSDGSGGGNSNQTGGGSGSGDSSSQDSNSQNSDQSQSDESESTLTAPLPGIYGDQSRVQIDVSRIPRLDEYLYADGVTTPMPRGDVRTVSYFLAGSPTGLAAMTTSATTASSATTSNATGGLARLEIDRATSLWQSASASAALDQNAVVLAPEVASLEFRYFDGSQWVTQWDSTAYSGAPRAVEISIYLFDDSGETNSLSATYFTAAGVSPMMDNPDNFYRLVVHLPAGLPLPAIPSMTTDDGSQTSEGGTSTNTGSSAGTSQQGGQR